MLYGCFSLWLIALLSLKPFFFGSAPALVGPQPHVRSGANVLLEHLHVLVCEIEIRMLCRGVRHRDELAVVVASARACHVSIVDHGAEFLCQHFCACEYGCFAVEEWGEMVYAFPFRLLVADEAYYDVLAVSFNFEDAAQGLFHRDALAAVLFAQLEEYAVGHFVVERIMKIL